MVEELEAPAERPVWWRGSSVLIYGPFEVDEHELSIRRAGAQISVRRRVVETIVFLMRSAGRLVTHDDIIAGPWKGVKVSAAAIHRTIMLARRALAMPEHPSPIATVHGLGFRFAGQVVQRSDRAFQPIPRRDCPRSAPLIERDRELAALNSALDGARAGRGSLVLVIGCAGSGKTALVDEFAAEAAHKGVTLARGWVSENGWSPALWPWIEVVRSLRERVGPLGGPSQLAQEIDRDVAALMSEYETDATNDAPPIRFRMFDAVTRYIGEVARRRDLLVIVEDVHAADESSTSLLEFIQARIRSWPVLIVVTSRSISKFDHSRSTLLRLRRLSIAGQRPTDVLTRAQAQA